jgi:hypothetical protein
MMKRYFAMVLVSFLAVGAVALSGPAFSEETGFAVDRLVVASGIEEREPVGVSETFPATQEEVYCFLEAGNIVKDTQVRFVWYFEGQETASVELPLRQGPRWRTWSSKKVAGKSGQWKVELEDEAGNTVGEATFTVQ